MDLQLTKGEPGPETRRHHNCKIIRTKAQSKLVQYLFWISSWNPRVHEWPRVKCQIRKIKGSSNMWRAQVIRTEREKGHQIWQHKVRTLKATKGHRWAKITTRTIAITRILLRVNWNNRFRKQNCQTKSTEIMTYLAIKSRWQRS